MRKSGRFSNYVGDAWLSQRSCSEGSIRSRKTSFWGNEATKRLSGMAQDRTSDAGGKSPPSSWLPFQLRHTHLQEVTPKDSAKLLGADPIDRRKQFAEKRKFVASGRFVTPNQVGSSKGSIKRREKTLLEHLAIHPANRFKLAFDLLVLAGIMYTAIMLPVKLAFNLGQPEPFEVCTGHNQRGAPSRVLTLTWG